MLIDCDACVMQHTPACDDCVVAALSAGEGTVDIATEESVALANLADAGLVAPVRLRLRTSERAGEAASG